MSEENNIRKIKETAKINTETTTFTSVSLESSKKVLPHNDIRKIVSSIDVFNEEREESTTYRFSFSIKDVFHNTNFNQTGKMSYEDINYILLSGNDVIDGGPRGYFSEYIGGVADNPIGNNIVTEVSGKKIYSGDYLTGYTKSIKETIIKKGGWYGYITGETDNCSIITLEPTTSRFEMINPTGGTNWDFLLTYPYTSDSKNYKFKSGTVAVPLSDGIAITNVADVNYDEINMTEFTTPINHNLVAGSEINIYKGNSPSGYTVYRTGDFSGNNRNNVFVVDMTGSTFSTPDLKFKRLVQNHESEYYVRKLKAFTGLTYDLFKESFATNIYGDKAHQLVYNDDVDLLAYKDNKGVFISELYLTAIKTNESNLPPVVTPPCVKCEEVYSDPADLPYHSIYIHPDGRVFYKVAEPFARIVFTIKFCEEGDSKVISASGGEAGALGWAVGTYEQGTGIPGPGDTVICESINGSSVPTVGVLTILVFSAGASKPMGIIESFDLNGNPTPLPQRYDSSYIDDGNGISGRPLDYACDIGAYDPCCKDDAGAVVTTTGDFWEPIQSGIQTKVDNNYNIRKLTRTKGIGMETNITTSNTDYCLDIVEYNKMEIREITLADVYHRTNTKNREDAGCEEGYFYLPHHFIKIRDLSNEIEFGDPSNVIGIPEWAENSTNDVDSEKMWRDIYTIGFVDADGNGVDYPFLNGVHYVFTNVQLNLLRQDPFNLYNLNASDCYVIGPYGIIEDDKEQDFYEC